MSSQSDVDDDFLYDQSDSANSDSAEGDTDTDDDDGIGMEMGLGAIDEGAGKLEHHQGR